MRRLGKERASRLNVDVRRERRPTRDLAQAIVDILPQIKPATKVYHFSNEGVCSWYDFATAIMAQSDLDCEVLPIESKDYPTPGGSAELLGFKQSQDKKDFGIN